MAVGSKLDPEAAAARWAEVERSQSLPKFDDAAFLAFVKSSRIDSGGDLEVTIHVQASQKRNALPLTDVPGMMLLFEVHPKPKRK